MRDLHNSSSDAIQAYEQKTTALEQELLEANRGREKERATWEHERMEANSRRETERNAKQAIGQHAERAFFLEQENVAVQRKIAVLQVANSQLTSELMKQASVGLTKEKRASVIHSVGLTSQAGRVAGLGMGVGRQASYTSLEYSSIDAPQVRVCDGRSNMCERGGGFIRFHVYCS